MWKTMSFDQREAEYSPSTVARAFTQTLQRYATASAAVLDEDRQIERRIYGAGDDEYVLLAATDIPGPLVVFIHGGYWQEGSAEDSLFPIPAARREGFSYAAVNYSLCPKASMADIVDQCRRAVLTLSEQWRTVAGSQPIILAGSSAGAHLVASMLATDWSDYGLVDAPFTRALLFSGIYELEPLIGTYVNDAVGLTATSAQHFSPAISQHIRSLPCLVCWGEYETGEFKRQSRSFAEKLLHAGALVQCVEAVDRDHFDIVFDLAERDTPLGRQTLNLIKGIYE